MQWRFNRDKQRRKQFSVRLNLFLFHLAILYVFREPWGHNDNNMVTAAAVVAWVHNFNFAKGGEILLFLLFYIVFDIRMSVCMIQLFWLCDTRCEQQKAKSEFESKLRNQEKQTKWIVHKIKGAFLPYDMYCLLSIVT